jgi:hypothetical protein
VVSPNIFLVLTFDQDLAVKGRLPWTCVYDMFVDG